MLKFSCMQCGGGIAVAEDARFDDVVCPQCHTRQPVPDDAADASRLVQASGPRPPEYPFANGIAACVIIAGVLQCLISVILTFTLAPALLLGVVSGLITIAVGSGLHILRDIAIDIWHVRNKP